VGCLGRRRICRCGVRLPGMRSPRAALRADHVRGQELETLLDAHEAAVAPFERRCAGSSGHRCRLRSALRHPIQARQIPGGAAAWRGIRPDPACLASSATRRPAPVATSATPPHGGPGTGRRPAQSERRPLAAGQTLASTRPLATEGRVCRGAGRPALAGRAADRVPVPGPISPPSGDRPHRPTRWAAILGG